MINFFSQKQDEVNPKFEALNKHNALIELDTDGTIIGVNKTFLNWLGYSLNELKNKHHSILLDSEYKHSAEYKDFWRDLAIGKYIDLENKIFTKDGKIIWVNSEYCPVRDSNDKLLGIIMMANDITDQKIMKSDFAGQLEAINKSQATIQFNMEGIILDANQNFLDTLGYELNEIKGKHHNIFVDSNFRDSSEYKQFWENLNKGTYQSAEYKRFGKNGKEVWIQASYNPIFDLNGKPYKVVKYAIDITEQKIANAESLGQISAISKSQAVIYFNNEGKILDANKNFLDTVEYSLDEIKDKHHSIFVDPIFKDSAEYKQFWENLRLGIYQSAEYKRFGKNGKEVWIQASYNPICDLNGKVYKIVKFATDITKQKLLNIDFTGQIDSINKSQAVIQFDLNGIILDANKNFLDTVGYNLDEIKGKHHSIFVDPGYKASIEYQQFWEELGHGKSQAAEYKRFGKNGKEVWIQASYNPIYGLDGKPNKIVKYATDITRQKLINIDFAGQINAIGKSQATIQFNMDGTIIDANENFLNTVGYALDEIKGRHHSMFVEPIFKTTTEYREFWENLNKGVYQSGEYKRIGKHGKEVWIQASYNPIFDINGKPIKVVKYATDITGTKESNANYRGQIEAINKSQAVIAFSMDGTILEANENFLNTLGYNLDEIKGKHHSLFVESAYKSSNDYKSFWESLNNGHYQAGEYKRLAKGGREVWIQASYNPIFNLNGKPVKVVKYATDITDMVRNRSETERGVSEIIQVLKSVAGGDLTERVIGNYSGGFVEIKDALNSTIEKLIETVTKIQSASTMVGNAASEISLGSTDLSKRTESQAASLEETAASMEELTGTVRKNASNTDEAAKNSVKARELAQLGGGVVKNAIGAMSEIEKSSKKVSNIINVIDEIAFQTNLLALNAAVEAARAGDAGRGFAVVASEVRSLAGRSSTSAKEIRQLIEESTVQVEAGSKLVNQAGQSLEEIVTANMGVNSIITDISNSTKEQTLGIEEISTTISQMDEMTQQNAALVEENTAALQSLVDQANQMKSIVAFFKIDGSEESNYNKISLDTNKSEIKISKAQTFNSKTKPGKTSAMQSLKTNLGSSGEEAGWEEF